MNSADVDSGLLTNKNQLPVSQLNYGDSAGRYSWIEYELGPLICQGQGGLYPSESFEHDFKFKVAANSQESFLTRAIRTVEPVRTLNETAKSNPVSS